MARGWPAADLDTAAAARMADAWAVATDCGVTRLADVTGLDRIGVPVCQAVRPLGKSLSVHQGKGLDAWQARASAIMEAIECSHAEAWAAPTWMGAHVDLPIAERSVTADDFADVRGGFSALSAIAWTAIERLDSHHRLWVPAAGVSLDLTEAGPDGVERSSNGQGAGFDLVAATHKGLCELIERDAYRVWMERGPVARMFDGIALETIGFGWFVALRERLTALGITLRLYRLPAVIAMPVVAAELHDGSAAAFAHSRAAGACAHPDAEIALRGAVLEAIQARLTAIAGVRDDLSLDAAEARPPTLGLALPPPAGLPAADFAEIVAAERVATASVDAIVVALATAGYPQVGRAILSPPGCPVTSVKMFIPGLGALDRARQPAR